MKHQVYFGIAIRIVILFSTGILLSFASPWLHKFFGDIPRIPNPNSQEIDKYWEWSAAHCWYFWGMLLLFILSAINLVVASFVIIKKHYNISI